MTTGATAALTLTFGGFAASDYGQEVDLTVDAGGDLLKVDPAGDGLMVTASIMNFTGVSAAFAGSLTGRTAALLLADASAAILTEAGLSILTETGDTVATEG